MSWRVFVVDDDRDHAESLADLLEIQGCAVELAYSGEEALRRCGETDFDLVLMDVKLPGMNGVEAFAQIKDLNPDARVLMMTGYSVEQLVAKAVENGALGVLHKPFSMPDLLDVLERTKPFGTVLVVDDDPHFLDSIVPLLTAKGYRVEVARSGDEAVRKLSSRTVDCLLLDVHLPVLSGAEVYARINELGRHIPTILVTGDGDHEEAQQLRRMTQGMLVKPFAPNDLLNALSRVR